MADPNGSIRKTDDTGRCDGDYGSTRKRGNNHAHPGGDREVKLMTFNQEQTEAVHRRGSIAGTPGRTGSGKTAVITARTAYLSETYKVSPFFYPGSDFYESRCQPDEGALLRMRVLYIRMFTSTFHGLFYGILKQAYGLSGRNIISEEEKKRIIRELLAGSGLEAEDERDVLELLQREISMVKTEQMPLDHFYSGSCPEEMFRQIYRKYHEIPLREKLLDFDDLMVYCYELFIKRPDILKNGRNTFSIFRLTSSRILICFSTGSSECSLQPQNNLFAVGTTTSRSTVSGEQSRR